MIPNRAVYHFEYSTRASTRDVLSGIVRPSPASVLLSATVRYASDKSSRPHGKLGGRPKDSGKKRTEKGQVDAKSATMGHVRRPVRRSAAFRRADPGRVYSHTPGF